ncbi:unnamed protein product [Rotaria magnacalcarata]|uniref:Protein quiver n=2 Tax=Rotaria magnacalcarata TaxID=392030 RepID=A0A816M534_9BILA|nr:unnamed protein product [Rotaria magnacalcarata]CAF1635762.1 unnamed protein product [Rotaria magnacalcarata]CAF1977113.1 unnamed protein product [Rotaria magnacalcarata]CAF4528183.1 unnamed protein product [Rotaria magnacalcarata]
MASNNFLIFCIVAITLACFIDTTLGASGWCYQCDSRDPGCQIDLNVLNSAHLRIPCNGQCYIRVKASIMSRGCSWEYGFMTRQIPYTPIYEQEAMWIFCDTALCNGHANGSA